jgi:hypothetical protein
MAMEKIALLLALLSFIVLASERTLASNRGTPGRGR